MRNIEIEKEMYRRAVELKELQPYHWTNAYHAEEIDHWEEQMNQLICCKKFDKKVDKGYN